MSSTRGRGAPAILAAGDGASLAHVVDVGGGDGTLLITLLTEHPGLRGTLVELAGPAAAAREAATAAGPPRRIPGAGARLLDPLPARAGRRPPSDPSHTRGCDRPGASPPRWPVAA